MNTITIIGAGYMGSAMAWPLTDNNFRVNLVGTHLDREIINSCQEKSFHPKLKRNLPEGVIPLQIEELAGIIRESSILIGGINSEGIHWFAKIIGPLLSEGQTILLITKGLRVTENGKIMILPDVVHNELPETIRDQITIAAIGGPCIAGELAGRRQTGVVLGCRDQSRLNNIAPHLRTSYYHVKTTQDLLSLEVCAALKNAYATAVGFGLGWLEKNGGIDQANAYAHNLESALFATAVKEMSSFLESVGGDADFAHDYPGAGDLFVTCQGGRSTKAGKLLGMGIKAKDLGDHMPNVTLESVDLIRQIGRSFPLISEFPLLEALAEVILDEHPPETVIQSVFNDF